jgi:tetratricopeptide (TPR) repeat protein
MLKVGANHQGEQGVGGEFPYRRRKAGRAVFTSLALVGLILLGLARSFYATRLDAFTIDEAWHITAGVSYVRTGDFRLNPEHPPLVKLWLGAALSGNAFHLPPFRALRDKIDEREFIDDTVYLENDAESVQRRTRLAMLSFHALLLLAFTLSVRRVFGSTMAFAALVFLLIDPTVAAHLPVALTDLPIALLSGTTMLLAIVAFRSWRKLDLALVALTLGLALSAKHSGLITVMIVAVSGFVMAVFRPAEKGSTWRRTRRLGMVAAAILGAFIVLWSSYGFRFNESKAGIDLFNRPLAEKINDLKSPLHKAALRQLARSHLLPRAYVWGLADIIRAGVEGRGIPLYFFGKNYHGKTPWYFFPGVLLVKLPLGLLALAAMGVVVILARKYPPRLIEPICGILAFAATFLVFLARSNSGYAGVRHALIVIPPLAILGALAIGTALEKQNYFLRCFAAIAVLVALISALPISRPWEYYNELAGGAKNAWRSFNDEGLDSGQRTRELIRYYEERLRRTGEVPYDEYGVAKQERKRRGLDLRSWQNETSDSDVISGTVFISAGTLAPRRIYDYAAFRGAEPVARFGSLLVYRGDFHLPWLRASNRLWRALEILYSQNRDVATAERLLRESVEIYPKAYPAALELGNLLAERGARAEAICAYEIARANALPGDEIVELLTHQIERVAKDPPEKVAPLRNPWLE